MRTRTDTYDQMLRVQAEMAFPYEHPLYQTHSWKNATQILDFGTGNGHYLRLLRNKYPDKTYFGVEYDPKMAERAISRLGDDTTIYVGSANAVPSTITFDYLMVRLAGLHLPDRKILIDLANRNGRSSLGVLIIDADDEHFLFNKEPKLFREALERLREKAVNRNLREVFTEEWTSEGFQKVLEHRILINSDFPDNKEKMYCYMYLTAELALGSPLSPDIAQELFDWLLDPDSYVQYGVFGTIFERK